MGTLRFTGLPAGLPVAGGFGDWYDVGGGRYQHRGVDHGLDGAPIHSRSTRPARAVAFTNDGSFGTAVCLEHEHDGAAVYELNAHMQRKLVGVGDTVQPGQLLGYGGATGTNPATGQPSVTGPHDHWQLCRTAAFPRDIAQSLDPLDFMLGEDEMTDEERELVVKLATVIAGSPDGQDFGSVAEALGAMRALARDDQIVMLGLARTQQRLGRHAADGHGAPMD